MSNELIVLGNFNGTDIHARPADRYVDVTEMGQANGRDWHRFIRLDSAKAFVEALSAKHQILVTDLVITTRTPDGQKGHTFADRRIALRFAAWISAEFEVWVYDRIEELLFPQQTQPTANIEFLRLQHAMIEFILERLEKLESRPVPGLVEIPTPQVQVSIGPSPASIIGVQERVRANWPGASRKNKARILNLFRAHCLHEGIACWPAVTNGPLVFDRARLKELDDIIDRVKEEAARTERFPLFDGMGVAT